MDTALSFCFTVFGCWKTNKSSLSLEAISKPFGFISCKLVGFVAEADTAVVWNWYGVFGVADAWKSFSVKRVMWYFIMLNIIKDILQTPVNYRVTIT